VHDLNDEQIALLNKAVSGRVYIWQTENKGRDVYPFHHQYVTQILGNYDIVGHFHTKKSKDLSDASGDRWRRYLLGNLIGSKVAIDEILALFNDRQVGLVFAEDAHCVDEADNGDYIEALLQQLGYNK